MNSQQEFVLRTVEERDIRFVRLWFTDILGYLNRWRWCLLSWKNALSEEGAIGFERLGLI